MAQKDTSLIVQNFMCIVYHDAKLPVHYRRQLKLRLNEIFYYIRTFHDVANFTGYIKNAFIVNKLVFIISGDQAGSLCDVINNRTRKPKNPIVYELQFRNEQLRSELTADKKFQCIDRLLERIRDDIREYAADGNECDQTTVHDDDEIVLQDSTISFGIHDHTNKQQSFCFLSKEEQKFVLFQSFIDVLLGIEISKEDVKSMWSRCRQDPINMENHFDQIDDFERDYDSKKAIRFYTKDSFLFRRVNKAFRCEHIAEIFAFRALITHIYEQLFRLLDEQKCNQSCSQYVLHRGKKLPKSVLQQLYDNQKKLISINGFLSTTKSTNIAETFADTLNKRIGYETVIFEMHLDEEKLNDTVTRKRPYADISKEAYNRDEKEVLFFMGFVWRIQSVENIANNTWKVLLELSTDVDINNEFRECTYFTLGKILHELGEYKDAISFYKRMLESSSDLPEKTQVDIHYHIAASAYMFNMYEIACDYLEKAERLIKEVSTLSKGILDPFQPILAEDSVLSPMSIATNKGLLYQKMNETSQARNLFVTALKKDGLATDKAKLYYYLGVLEFECGHYEDARNYYHQADPLAEDQTLKAEIKKRLDVVNKRIVRKVRT